MNDIPIGSIRESYDQLAEAYTNHLFHELQNKPFDRNLLDRFAAEVSGQVCDMGCGPGHVARYLLLRTSICGETSPGECPIQN